MRFCLYAGLVALAKVAGMMKIDTCIRNRVTIPLADQRVEFCSFYGLADAQEHLALVYGGADLQKTPLVRMHSECITGDLFGSQKCDCGAQLNESQAILQEQGGILLYLRQEGRGIGLYNKLDAYVLQNQGFDTFEANEQLNLQHDLRDYQVAASMLQALGVNEIRLLTNNPDKVKQLTQYGIRVAERIGTGVYMTPHNNDYLLAKTIVTGHKIGEFND